MQTSFITHPSGPVLQPRKRIMPQDLGAAGFRSRYGTQYAYLTGSMYKGISSKEMVVAIGRAGLLGFLGTAGMRLDEIENDILFIRRQLDSGRIYGANLICSLNDPQMEMDTVELYLKYGVTCIEASAFMQVTPALVYYRLRGIHEDGNGDIVCPNRIIAKASRPEVVKAFLSPPPADIVEKLLGAGRITRQEAALGDHVAMSFDICVEADSGGHTNQGVAAVLLPVMQGLREQMAQKHHYHQQIHVGLAGGIGTPQAAVGAFMMGADFILTGSINQCTVEAGTSDHVKDLLQRMNVQDTDYAPAGDMFEIGAKVQVLKKGVFFPARANKLYMLYNHYDAWEDIPKSIRDQIESKFFRKDFAQVWQEVQAYHQSKGRYSLLDSARANPKQKMALTFRWYFVNSTRMAIAGDARYQVDFQVHTSPALGAFNQWVQGSELEPWRHRHVDHIAEKLMQETARLLESRIDKLIIQPST